MVIWGNGANLDDRHAGLREPLQAFEAANNLALIGTGEMLAAMGQGEGAVLLDGLRALAARSGHTEFGRDPIFSMGHSNGGGMASGFNSFLPERVGAFVASHGATFEDDSKLARNNPGIFTAGENDPKIPLEYIANLFARVRAQGTRISLAVEEGAQHPAGPASTPFFLFTLQHVVEQRLRVREPGKLLPVDSTRAWLADNSTWKQGITKIMPAAGFGGDLSTTSWLLDKDAAYVYRGIATYGNPLQLARSGGQEPAYRRDETHTLECTGFGDREWKSIGVYDGAERVGEVSRAQAKLTLRFPQKPGAHAAVLVGELRNGELRTSLPVLWPVWP